MVEAVNPSLVGRLDKAWDVSVVNPTWMQKPEKMVKQRLPGVGMFHFNGGGTSPVSFFEAGNPVHFVKDKFWNLAKYYVDLPWSWALHQMSSKTTATQQAYAMHIDFEVLESV